VFIEAKVRITINWRCSFTGPRLIFGHSLFVNQIPSPHVALAALSCAFSLCYSVMPDGDRSSFLRLQ
ncbi:hypothetical protein, partial [Paraburkholderia sp. SIMBA_053]|uniref:hypothetical protein n=1 Tax=Paraburkholderia sp. SIMBA_053 TaxID=3085794 RepID=UPI00397A801B